MKIAVPKIECFERNAEINERGGSKKKKQHGRETNVALSVGTTARQLQTISWAHFKQVLDQRAEGTNPQDLEIGLNIDQAEHFYEKKQQRLY